MENHHAMDKSTIFMVVFNSKLLVRLLIFPTCDFKQTSWTQESTQCDEHKPSVFDRFWWPQQHHEKRSGDIQVTQTKKIFERWPKHPQSDEHTYIYIYIHIHIYRYHPYNQSIWLVVSTPLKNMTQIGSSSQIYFLKNMFQTMQPINPR